MDTAAKIERIRRLVASEQQSGPATICAAQTVGTGGGGAVQYAVVTQAPEYNDPAKAKYVVQKASVVGGVWTGDGTDLTITRALGYEGYPTAAQDIRNWLPWYLVGAVVRIVERWDEAAAANAWYLDMPQIYGGAEDASSLRQSEITGHPEAVWV